MSDQLRDRIAAVVYRHVLFRALDECECGESFDGFCGRALDAYSAHVADAVIAELEPLRQQLLAYARSGVEHGDMTPTSERVLKRIMAHYWQADA